MTIKYDPNLKLEDSDKQEIREGVDRLRNGLISMTELFEQFKAQGYIVHWFNPISHQITVIRAMQTLSGYYTGPQEVFDYRPLTVQQQIQQVKDDFTHLSRRIREIVEQTDLKINQFDTDEVLKGRVLAEYPNITIADYAWEFIFKFWNMERTRVSRNFFGLTLDSLDQEKYLNTEKILVGGLEDAKGDCLRLKKLV